MRITVDPTLTRLLRDVSAGIRVLQIRDGIILTENQILERARNIVMGLVGNYRIESLEDAGGAAGQARIRGIDGTDGEGIDGFAQATP